MKKKAASWYTDMWPQARHNHDGNGRGPCSPHESDLEAQAQLMKDVS